MVVPPKLPPPLGERRSRAGTGGRGRYGRLLDADYNPGGARWCEEHGKLECTKRANANGRADRTCHRNALRGTDTCRSHVQEKGGSMVVKFKGEAQITAWSVIDERGGILPGANLDPGQAVLAMLQMAWFRAGTYAELLRLQVEREELKASAIEGEIDGPPGVGALIGQKMSATTAGEIYATSEEVRALVQLEANERDRVVEYAQKAHKMGISERVTSLAEQWGDVTAGRVVAMLDELRLTPEQQARVGVLVQKHLSNIDLTGIGGTGR